MGDSPVEGVWFRHLRTVTPAVFIAAWPCVLPPRYLGPIVSYRCGEYAGPPPGRSCRTCSRRCHPRIWNWILVRGVGDEGRRLQWRPDSIQPHRTVGSVKHVIGESGPVFRLVFVFRPKRADRIKVLWWENPSGAGPWPFQIGESRYVLYLGPRHVDPLDEGNQAGFRSARQGRLARRLRRRSLHRSTESSASNHPYAKRPATVARAAANRRGPHRAATSSPRPTPAASAITQAPAPALGASDHLPHRPLGSAIRLARKLMTTFQHPATCGRWLRD